MLLNGEIKIVGEEPDWEQLLDDAMSGKLCCERLGLGDGREFATYNGLDGMKARIGTATYTGTTSYTVGTIFALQGVRVEAQTVNRRYGRRHGVRW